MLEKYLNFDLLRSDISELETQIAQATEQIDQRVAEFRTQCEVEASNQISELTARRNDLMSVLGQFATPAEVVDEANG